ncbi:MAG: TonB-dependent receptor [Gammaproteobacteria bacterium]|nr:TonB-dependent receptor [Gammaproteobacteria bacterium]
MLPHNSVDPEIIETRELAFDYRARDDIHFALNLYNYRWRDIIRFLPVSINMITAQNSSGQTGHGLELETRWKVSNRFSLLANYAWQRVSGGETRREPGKTGHHQGYLRGDWLLIPCWYLNIQINRVGKRGRRFDDPRTNLDGYTSVDLTLRRKSVKTSHWNFALGVRNLFDADRREPGSDPDNSGIVALPNDLPLAGRHYFAELRYRF